MSDIKTDHAAKAFTQLSAELAVDRHVFASVTEELRREVRDQATGLAYLLTATVTFWSLCMLAVLWARTGCPAP